MKRACQLLMIIVGFAGLVSCQSFAGTPQSSKAVLTPEELQVYGDFIDSFSKTNFKFLSDKTFPLDLSGFGKDAPCLQGIQLEEANDSVNATHQLVPEVLRGHAIHFADAQEEVVILKWRDADVAAHGSESAMDTSGMTRDPGVLALSEIVFNKSHDFAILKYVFLCGSHCNSGAILALEKVGSRWSGKTRRACTFALNRDNHR
jgi:hypothetical protein